jgi:FkbM family methyltransferase
VKKQFKVDETDSGTSIFSSDNFARLLVSLCTHLNVDFTLYLGAHAGFWIMPIKSALNNMEFLCLEANPIVYNRYNAKLSRVKGVEYKNLAVSLDGGEIVLKIPLRKQNPRTVLKKIDRFIFRIFHESFEQERAGWETEATIVDSPVHELYYCISVPSLSLTEITNRIDNKHQVLLLTDLEGFDYELIDFNREHLTRFKVICFEYHFNNHSQKSEQISVLKNSFHKLGYELIAVGADYDSPALVNLLFYKLSACTTVSFDCIVKSAEELTLSYWRYTPSLASRLGDFPGKSLVLRLVSLTGYDVFKSR